MPRVLRSEIAADDLIEIWAFIAQDDERAADRVLEKIHDTASLLAANPSMGRLRDELAAGLRSIPVGSYIIYYRPIEDGIEIARVLHGARDITELQ